MSVSLLTVSVFVRSAGGEDPAEFDETQAGDRPDGCEDRRRRAHAAAGQAQRKVQHDARHARHQHPRTAAHLTGHTLTYLSLCFIFS